MKININLLSLITLLIAVVTAFYCAPAMEPIKSKTVEVINN
jgi:hypothetical protein